MSGFVRGLDAQRRLIIPKEALVAAGIVPGDMVEVWADTTPDGVPCLILSKHIPRVCSYEGATPGVAVSVRWPYPISDEARKSIMPYVDELLKKAEEISKKEEE